MEKIRFISDYLSLNKFLSLAIAYISFQFTASGQISNNLNYNLSGNYKKHFTQVSSDYPFKLNKNDYFIISAAVGVYITEKLISNPEKDKLTLDEISLLDRTTVNRFDRSTTYNRNTSIGNAGDVVETVLPILPVLMLSPQLYKKEWGNAITFGVMYLETYFLTQGITGIIKTISHRVRPVYYNTSFTVEERFNMQENYEAPEGKTSFVSGHATRTFASAFWMSKVFTDTYGTSKWCYAVWGTSLTAATFTAYSRVADGEHFPSDVLAGAVIGSAIGYLVPLLHKTKNEKLSYAVLPGSFKLVCRF